MGKIFVYIYNDMADYEITFTCYMLNGNIKHKITPIAYTMNNIKALSGIIYTPVMTVNEAIEYDNIEGLIIPGGKNDEQRPELTKLINKTYKKGKLTAAICVGPRFLARAGVLEDKKFTTSLSPEYFVEEKKEDPFNWDNFIKQKVIRDGNIITAPGVSFVDFTAEIMDFYKLFEDEAGKKDFGDTFK
jgi:transcriptional regulator GlxA family with amidase domain